MDHIGIDVHKNTSQVCVTGELFGEGLTVFGPRPSWSVYPVTFVGFGQAPRGSVVSLWCPDPRHPAFDASVSGPAS